MDIRIIHASTWWLIMCMEGCIHYWPLEYPSWISSLACVVAINREPGSTVCGIGHVHLVCQREWFFFGMLLTHPLLCITWRLPWWRWTHCHLRLFCQQSLMMLVINRMCLLLPLCWRSEGREVWWRILRCMRRHWRRLHYPWSLVGGRSCYGSDMTMARSLSASLWPMYVAHWRMILNIFIYPAASFPIIHPNNRYVNIIVDT